MSEDGRMLALYLITSPHNTIAGVFRLPDGYVCEDLQWVPARVREAFDELLRNGFAVRCEATKWVWVLRHLEWNKPENPNQMKAAKKVVRSVPPETSWMTRFVGVWGGDLDLPALPAPNPSTTVPQPFANQEQEQDQEQSLSHTGTDLSVSTEDDDLPW